MHGNAKKKKQIKDKPRQATAKKTQVNQTKPTQP